MPNDQEQLRRKLDGLMPWLVLTVFLAGVLLGVLGVFVAMLFGNPTPGGPGQ